MYTVTGRIAQIKSPTRFLNRKMFTTINYGERVISDGENAHAGLIGITVPYLALIELGYDPYEVYRIALDASSYIFHKDIYIDENFPESVRPQTINYDDAISIAAYEAFYRSGVYKQPDYINDVTKNNIKQMVDRMVKFFKGQRSIINFGGDFKGGYSSMISKGDYDILTEDTLFDIKTSKNNFTPKDMLQLLVYYEMGLHSIYHDEFIHLDKLAIYNPRLNSYSYILIEDIPDETFELVRNEVIKY